jgi:hypothetical protein
MLDTTGLENLAWLQRENETDKAYAAFLMFRDLGRSRTVEEAYLKSLPEEKKQQKAAKSSNLRPSGAWTNWLTDHQWRERVREWDRVKDEERAQLATAIRTKNIEKYLSDLDTDATNTRTILHSLQKKLGTAVQGIDLSHTPIQNDSEGGKTSTVTQKRPINPHILLDLIRTTMVALDKAESFRARALGLEDLARMINEANENGK